MGKEYSLQYYLCTGKEYEFYTVSEQELETSKQKKMTNGNNLLMILGKLSKE